MLPNGSSPGRKFGNYRITDVLGSGGMGTVYRARDESRNLDVALKVMDLDQIADARDVERFEREARLASRLDHPNVVHIVGTGEEHGCVYLAMELVEGESLRSLIRDHQGGLPVELALDISGQILSALGAAHEAGIVHRDIKPENVIRRPDGMIKVLDFGVARIEGAMALTRPNDFVGTVEYMAPEQILAEGIGPGVDLYASGVMLYEMLTGSLPFSGDSPATLVYHQLNEDPRPPSVLHPDFPAPWIVWSCGFWLSFRRTGIRPPKRR